MKTRILFLIVFLTIPDVVLAEGPTNWSMFWKSFTIGERISYLDGYAEGVLQGYWETLGIVVSDLTKDKLKSDRTTQAIQLAKEIYLDIDMTVLSVVISDLYDDPANSYVETGDMAYIARDKIQGKPIEDRLLGARRKAQDAYKLMR